MVRKLEINNKGLHSPPDAVIHALPVDIPFKCERSSAGEHALHTGGVTGSIPVARTIHFNRRVYQAPYKTSNLAAGSDALARPLGALVATPT